MSTRKKPLSGDIERALIKDADNPDAWEEPITVKGSASPRPSWYGKHRSQPAVPRIATSADEPQLVGEAAMSFANLEHCLEIAMWQLVIAGDENQQPLVEAITAEMSFDRKVIAFANLFRLRFPNETDDPELQATLDDLFIAYGDRNAILHTMAPAFVEIAAIRDNIAGIGRRFADFSMTRVHQRIAPQKIAG
jgi:hypothetical protein